MPPDTPVFVFHGDVVAFGTLLDRPRRREVKGTVSLARVGGRASVQDEAVDLDGLIRYRYASSAASGESYRYPAGDTHETRTTCTLEGFEYGALVRADFVSATLVSTFKDHHRFVEENVALRGLWADGRDRAVEKRVPKILRQPCRGLAELKAMAQKDGVLTSNLAQVHTARDGSPSPHAGKLVQTSNGHLVCYLLEPSYITFRRRGIRYELFLGEYFIYDGQRRLTMLRIEARPVLQTDDDCDGEDERAGSARAIAAPGADEGPPPDEDDPESLEGSTSVAQLTINGHRHP